MIEHVAEEATLVDVNDELCPDDKYHENDGQSAFKCNECKMLYLPGIFMCRNKIEEFSSCRTHLGVHKCKMCVMDVIGLEKIRMHRETCLVICCWGRCPPAFISKGTLPF